MPKKTKKTKKTINILQQWITTAAVFRVLLFLLQYLCSLFCMFYYFMFYFYVVVVVVLLDDCLGE